MYEKHLDNIQHSGIKNSTVSDTNESDYWSNIFNTNQLQLEKWCPMTYKLHQCCLLDFLFGAIPEPPLPCLVAHLLWFSFRLFWFPNSLQFLLILLAQLWRFFLSNIQRLIQCMPPCYEGLRGALFDVFFIHPINFSMHLILIVYPILQSILRLLLLFLVTNTRVHLLHKGVNFFTELFFHHLHWNAKTINLNWF